MNEISKSDARHINIRMGYVPGTTLAVEESEGELKIDATFYDNPYQDDGKRKIVPVATLTVNINQGKNLLDPDGIRLEQLHKIAAEIDSLFRAIC